MSVSQEYVGRCGEKHAITDVYCEHKRMLLIEYPTWLVAILILAGVAAFMVVGFFGYRGDGLAFFAKPWALFLWLCALALALWWAILRRVSRIQRFATLMLVFLSIALVGAIDLCGKELAAWIRDHVGSNWANLLQTLSTLPDNPTTYVVVNYTIIALFFADSLFRWISRALGRKPVWIIAGKASATAGLNDPSVLELIAGDLIIGALLFFGMSSLARPESLQWIANAAHAPIACLSPHAPKFCSTSPTLPATLRNLSTVDWYVGLFCIPFGLLTLFVSSLLVGLDLLPDQPASPSAFDRIARVLVGTLRGAVYRRTPIGIALLLSPRIILWPALIFFAISSLAAYSRLEQQFLQGGASDSLVFVQGIAWLALAIICAPTAVAVQLLSQRVLANTLGLVGWVLQILLSVFWVAALALFVFNYLFVDLGWILPINPGGCTSSFSDWVSLPPFTRPPACGEPFALSWIFLVSLVFSVWVITVVLARWLKSMRS